GSVPTLNTFTGNRAATETYATDAAVSWSSDTGWMNIGRTATVGAPQSRDIVTIGSFTGTIATLNDSGSHRIGNLTIGRVDQTDPGSPQNWSNGTLNIDNATSLRVVEGVNVASYNDNTTNGTLNLSNGSTLTVGGQFRLSDATNST